MYNDEFKKMNLNFDEEEKNSLNNDEFEENGNVFYMKDDMDLNSESNDSLKENNLKEKVDIRQHNINTVVDEHVEFVTEESKFNNKNLSIKQRGKRGLYGIIFWSIILFLTILFGANSIYDFINELLLFIDDVNNNDGWHAVLTFLMAFAYVWEAFMFGFFILFSIVKILKHRRPWKEYRLIDSDSRDANKKQKLERKNEKNIKKREKITKEREDLNKKTKSNQPDDSQ